MNIIKLIAVVLNPGYLLTGAGHVRKRVPSITTQEVVEDDKD